jgi:replicative DNA helicase Mcm
MAEKRENEERIAEAKGFFDTYKKEIGQSIRENKRVIQVDFNDLAAFSHLLAEELLSSPEEILQILETALDDLGLIKNARVRFTNIPETQTSKIGHIRAKHLNKFISIEGIVRQASDVRPQVVNAKFECPTCGTVISVLQIEKKFREPSRCSCGRKGMFRLISKEMVDAQRIIIEESPESLMGGEQPRRLQVFLQEDLVEPKMEEKTTPGARVKVIGVLKEVPVPLQTGSISTRFDLAIEANNIIPLEETYEEVKISEEDERQIQEIAADAKVFEKLASSIAPSIWGYDEIKKALVLQMFSGVRKVSTDRSVKRGDIHILLMGDPGVAKSVTLKFISDMAPKGRYIVGKAASGAGITATVVKDEYLKGWALEAGAMVLANKGIVCIDEIEKMDPNDRSAMHEAMEQQCMLPDFKLMLSNGEYVKIGEYVDNLIENNKNRVVQGKDCEILKVDNTELLSTDFTNSFHIKASKVSRHVAPKNFIKIKLMNGREITVTPEHPCWIVEDGKIKTMPAEKMKEGMFFPIPSEINIKEKEYKKENDILCKILGYHISDGCYELNRGKKTGIQFCNKDMILIEDYKNAVENFFKIKAGLTKRGEVYSVRVISKKAAEEVYKLDKNLMEKGIVKAIPDKIMQLPKENLKYLIRALFDGDGTVTFQKRNGCRAALITENIKLAEQVSDILLRFGIQSSIFQDKTFFKVDITGQENLLKFLLNISFLSAKKKERLKSYCEKEKTYKSIRDIIPNCTEKISSIFKKLNISMDKELGHSIDLHVEKHRLFLQKLILIAEKKLAEFKGKKEDLTKSIKELKKLAFGYARWVKVKKVSRIINERIKWVYDVTIEPDHTFISNGMILHNTVTISKANVQATLQAQTSVLAAGNPKLGRFEPFQTIAQQIDLPPSLINRFDVIFVLRDIPDKFKDESIASHVLSQYQKSDRVNPIDRELFRKYVAYAKQKVHPILSDEAVKEIRDFYVKMRNTPISADSLGTKSIPISARQLEALVRLSEAHAKMRLSKRVTKEDAKIAIEIIKYYMMQVGYDPETKSFDIDRIAVGVSTSQRSKVILLRETISKLEERLGKFIPQEELEKELEGKLSKDEIDDSIQKLIASGDVFIPRKGFVQRI